MKIEQIYTGCLAQGAYYIESKGEAVVIDPLREVGAYIDKAKADNAKIKYIFETHFHADFVSGHLDLAAKTGATIVYGPTAKPGFEAHVAEDGEIFKVGDITIKAIHTPGHTMESTCFLLIDENGKEHSIYTGDTLFIGDVGRPDLAQKVIADLTQEKLASHLYDSLRNKIMTLSDDLIVYPAHGAGSACGKKMSKETFDTLGNQKRSNYALNPDLSREEFIEQVLDGLMPPPAYFPQNVLMNIQGYDSLDKVMARGKKALTPKEFEAVANETGAVVIDTRSQNDFKNAFIPNSIFIGIDGSFATWVGTLIPDLKQEILIVAEEGREEEVITRLARVGYDYSLGYLAGGLKAWKEAGFETDSLDSVSPGKLAQLLKTDENIHVLDVRKESEYKAQHIDDKHVMNLPLDYISENMQKINRDEKYYIHCAGGYRSVIAASILKARGFDNLVDIELGFKGIENADIKTTAYVCPSTLL
ncbi:MAG: MBL fold metallo-hydrolase [Chitinophagales bacterium]|nr:MBL fold metallo-hydrolase [Bacteroidota bacterium]MCB9256692.1 MBL fold metallo-hydrolase [Chitinophagales bacterium]